MRGAAAARCTPVPRAGIVPVRGARRSRSADPRSCLRPGKSSASRSSSPALPIRHTIGHAKLPRPCLPGEVTGLRGSLPRSYWHTLDKRPLQACDARGRPGGCRYFSGGVARKAQQRHGQETVRKEFQCCQQDSVTPAQAGVQARRDGAAGLDSRWRGNDGHFIE